jgi:hypothetical protein
MNIVFAVPGLLTDSTSVEGKRARSIIKKCVKVVGKARLEPGVIVFTVVNAFDKRSLATKNAIALEALMTCLTELDMLFLQCRPNTPFLYDTPVYYERTIVWDTIPALYARGFGDCKSLAACRVAELRRIGIPCRPVFRFDSNAQMTMFHILVMLEDGTFEDPSKIKGMIGPQEAANG